MDSKAALILLKFLHDKAKSLDTNSLIVDFLSELLGRKVVPQDPMVSEQGLWETLRKRKRFVFVKEETLLRFKDCTKQAPVLQECVEYWEAQAVPLILTHITCQNFLRFKDLSINILQLCTTIVGPSGSGKSSILEVIWEVLAGNKGFAFSERHKLKSVRPTDFAGPVEGQSSKRRSSTSENVAVAEKPGRVVFTFDKHELHLVYGQAFQIRTKINENQRIVFVPQEYGLIRKHVKSNALCYVIRYDEMGARLKTMRTTSAWMIPIIERIQTHIARISNMTVLVDNGDFLVGNEDNIVPFSGLSGGELDCFLTLFGMSLAFERKHSHGKALLLLDEPGQNLGASQRHLLCKTIRQFCNDAGIQCLIVTHHVEMLDRDALPLGIVRVDKEYEDGKFNRQILATKSYGPLSYIQPKLSNAELLPLWFSRGVILVEGDSERRFFDCLNEFLLQFHNKRLKWVVLPFGGGDFYTPLINICKDLKIPYLLIQDSDKMYQNAGGGTLDHIFLKHQTLNFDEEKGKFSKQFASCWSGMINRGQTNNQFYWPLNVCDIEGLLINKDQDHNISVAQTQWSSYFLTEGWTEVENEIAANTSFVKGCKGVVSEIFLQKPSGFAKTGASGKAFFRQAGYDNFGMVQRIHHCCKFGYPVQNFVKLMLDTEGFLVDMN